MSLKYLIIGKLWSWEKLLKEEGRKKIFFEVVGRELYKQTNKLMARGKGGIRKRVARKGTKMWSRGELFIIKLGFQRGVI